MTDKTLVYWWPLRPVGHLFRYSASTDNKRVDCSKNLASIGWNSPSGVCYTVIVIVTKDFDRKQIRNWNTAHFTQVICGTLVMSCYYLITAILFSSLTNMSRTFLCNFSSFNCCSGKILYLQDSFYIWNYDVISVSYTHLTLPTICSV